MNRPRIFPGAFLPHSIKRGAFRGFHKLFMDGETAQAVKAVPELLKALEDTLPLLFHTANAQRRTFLDEQQAQAAWNQAQAALEKAGYTF